MQIPSATLFVYGTLMPGRSHHDLIGPLLESHRPAVLELGWLFLLPAGYPALVLPADRGRDGRARWPGSGGAPDWGPSAVHGTICRLTGDGPELWRQLDAYEDCDPSDVDCLYRREQHEVSAPAPTTAWVYTWNPLRLAELTRVGTPIMNGRF